MNIIFFITSLGGGGAERVLSDLANNMVQRGCNVEITVLRGNQKQYPLESEIKIDYLQPDYYTGSKSHIYRLQEIRKVKRFLKRIPSDSLLVSFLELPMAYSLLFRKLYKSRLIICERSNPARYSKTYQWIFRHISKRADGCVCQTQYVKGWYSTYVEPSCFLQVIPNPLSKRLNDICLVKSLTPKIVTAGRLVPVKNHMLLLDAFSVVLQRHPNCTLYIYGEGPLKSEMIEKAKSLGISDNAFFPGFVSDVANSIKDATVFVLTSDYEGMPNALAEAMAIGLPCISTNFEGGGAKELIDDGDNGLIIPCNDKDALVDALFAILNNEKLASSLGMKAKQINNKLNQEVIFQMWYDLFYEVINK